MKKLAEKGGWLWAFVAAVPLSILFTSMPIKISLMCLQAFGFFMIVKYNKEVFKL
jgi:hypothetical protein